LNWRKKVILSEINLTKIMAEKLYKGLYQIRSLRNPHHDYGSLCWYMITINTFNRKDYFGTIAKTDHCPSLQTTRIADFAMSCWSAIPEHHPQITLDGFVFMSNHIHGLVKYTPDPHMIGGKFGVQSRNLASAIRGFKATVKRFANEEKIDFNWQPGYHDRIIYTEDQLNNCRNYIEKNIINTSTDK
jgi:putative transposase